MAHFAKIEEGIVREVVVVSNDDCGGGEYPQADSIGNDFLNSLGLTGEWKQTSYHGNFRGRFAGVGYTYDTDLDEFIEPIVKDASND